ncbi:phosphotransferase enzyme family protein [Heyndrickxia vini]|uniref:Phosphotransferase n=1 Tax=Heyndrickxia vini TaxID=1476025 RepID=A0ABX7E4S2_9BACI|nr:phosphotransferase [Heyndrickxia vini]QQZ10295.1 phosphotransferase [Heyndrickxia vini]
MEQFVEKLFTQEVIENILTTFNLDHSYKKLGDFENYVFEVNEQGKPKILRITHSSHRSKQELESELDWIQHLYRCGIKIPNVLLSPEGNTVEKFTVKDSAFFASLFEKASGHPISLEDSIFNEKLFYKWGKMIGKMHRHTKEYQPSERIVSRHHWDANDLLDFEKYYGKEESQLLEHAKNVVQEIKQLTKSKDNYGLIHSDIHHGNFFYDGEMIHVFDFDDACYHYFVSDIAIPLYYATNSKHFIGTREERNRFAKKFLTAFLDGYQEENKLPREWIKKIPLFLKLRDIDLYAVFNKKVAPEQRNDRVKHWMQEIKERMKKNEAIVDIEFLT